MHIKRRRRPVVFVALTMLLGLTSAGVARAQGYGLLAPDGAMLNDKTLALSQRFTVNCGNPPCITPGSDVEVGITSTFTSLGYMTADSDGDYSGTFTIPARYALGAHSIVVNGTLNGAPVSYTTGVSVHRTAAGSDVGSPSTNPTLPRTGWDIVLLIAWGLILLGFGAITVLIARRWIRARHEHHAEHDATAAAESERSADSAARR